MEMPDGSFRNLAVTVACSNKEKATVSGEGKLPEGHSLQKTMKFETDDQLLLNDASLVLK